MPDQQAYLDIQRRAGVTVVSFLDRKVLEELNIARIEEELFTLVDGEQGIRLVLDFGNVEHLSSRAIGTLISLMKRVRGQQGRLVLTNIAERIFEVFRRLKMNMPTWLRRLAARTSLH